MSLAELDRTRDVGRARLCVVKRAKLGGQSDKFIVSRLGYLLVNEEQYKGSQSPYLANAVTMPISHIIGSVKLLRSPLVLRVSRLITYQSFPAA